MDTYPITSGDGRTTEELVRAGKYGYAHSCVESANFPARNSVGQRAREVVLLAFDHEITTEQALVESVRLGLGRPMYEDALYFGIEHPDVQLAGPVVFLHEPWVGFYGRRDALCLWSNAGRRELGLEDFDSPWSPDFRLAFIKQ